MAFFVTGAMVKVYRDSEVGQFITLRTLLSKDHVWVDQAPSHEADARGEIPYLVITDIATRVVTESDHDFGIIYGTTVQLDVYCDQNQRGLVESILNYLERGYRAAPLDLHTYWMATNFSNRIVERLGDRYRGMLELEVIHERN